jgi:hypothetical protein
MLQHDNDNDVLLKAINLVAFFIPAPTAEPALKLKNKYPTFALFGTKFL